MAIPTSFIICTPNATVTKVSPMLGHGAQATPNLVLMDIAGTVTPKTIVLGANISIVMSAAFTDAQIIDVMMQYLQNLTPNVGGAAGGYKAQDSKQIAVALSTCT